MNQFNDLTPRIVRDLHLTDNEASGVDAAMSWLQMHPNDVPKLTVMTESEWILATWDLDAREADGFKFGLDFAGIEIISDPEPTEAQKLATDIKELDFECNLGAENLAEELIKRGWTNNE